MFVAVELPQAVKEAAAAFADAWQAMEPGARWVRSENLHLTLKFLGETDRAGDVAEALAGVRDVAPFDATLGGPGAFPSVRRARVLWIGIDDPAAGFDPLSTCVDDVMVPLGFDRETRPRSPHLTLARITRPHAIVLPPPPAPVRFVVDHVVLFRSHLGRGGARYESICVVGLAGPG